MRFPRWYFFCGSLMFFLSCFCYAFVIVCLYVLYGPCWERADLLALVCGVYCEFVTFPLVSWVRRGTWLFRFLIFAPLLTLYRETSLNPTVKLFLLTVPRQSFFCGSFLFFIFRICHAMLSCLFIVAMWSPVGKGLGSWLSCMSCFSVFFSRSMRCLG